MPEQTPILYDFYRSSAAYRVRTALVWKNIDYKSHPINLHIDENKSEAYRKLVPTEKVPAFSTKDGHILSQSMAILEYSEEVYPERPLLPKDPYQRAVVREVAQIIACDIHPLQTHFVLDMASGVDNKEKQAEFARDVITRGFTGLEGRVNETAGKYSVGDSISFADVSVVPMIFNAYAWGVDMTQFPTLVRLYETLLEVPEFKKAHPFSQPDCPEELRFKE